MNNTPAQVLLHTEGFALRDELRVFAETKAGKVLRHTFPRVHLLRLTAKRETPHSGAAFFSVCATAENEGPDHVVHATGAEPEAAINEALHKLERTLSASAGARKHDLHRPSPLKAMAEREA